MLKFLLVAFLGFVMFPSGPAPAQEMPVISTNITREDLIAHPVGREVKELTDRMRKVAKAADNQEKGSDAYNLLKAGFEKRKKERDQAGEDIRGLRGFEIVLNGDRAINDAAHNRTNFPSTHTG